MRALKNVKEAELIGMPKLKRCVLMGGLKNVKSVRMENAGKLESVKGLKELMEEERREEEKKKKERGERRKRRRGKRKEREREERKRKGREERRGRKKRKRGGKERK